MILFLVHLQIKNTIISMGCCKTKIDLCYLIQETYVSPTFNFKDIDVSQDTFIYKTNKLYTCTDEKVFDVGFIDDNTVYIIDVDLPISEYNHELIWIRNGIETVVFQGKLTITNKANNCGCGNNKFTFEVINEDVVISVDFEERIIERITDKGPQGDSAYQVAVENGFVGTEAEWLESLKLHYSDLTEAEILELKQPAIEAAQTANQAADNANTATQNAITATNEANTATVSANQSAQTANASATNADNSADLATSAATNANDAATAANTAANFANSQRGWSPKLVFEEDGATRLVKKLDSWIGGTGDAPTENVGMYVINGGYTSDISLAENFKGAQSDNLIAEYIHSGNKEVYIDSVDYETNTFTSLGHGLADGDRVVLLPEFELLDTWDVDMSKFIPMSNYGLLTVMNATSDTFQLGTGDASVLTLVSKPNATITSFKVERTGNNSGFNFTNLGDQKAVEIFINGFGRVQNAWLTFRFPPFGNTGTGSIGLNRNPGNTQSLFSNITAFFKMKIKLVYSLNSYNSVEYNYSIVKSSYKSDMNVNYHKVWKNTGELINYFGGGLALCNGTTIQIFKL